MFKTCAFQKITICFALFIFLLSSCSKHSASDEVTTTNGSIIINMGSQTGSYRDVLGINKAPRGTDSQSLGANAYNIAALYQMIGISNVRSLDSYFDVCEVYTDDTLVNYSTGATLTNCINTQGTHAVWSANSSGSNVNNTSSYNFNTVNTNLEAIYSSGAGLYLRLGENNDGPNDTTDFSSWATVAKNLYRHVSGVSSGFGLPPTHTINPEYIELTNEPDSSFWMGTAANYYTLYNLVWDTIDAIAPSTVKIGGSGFSNTFETHLNIASNVAKNFIANVTTSRLDFLSAHVYGSCDSATLTEMVDHMNYLRSYMNSNGLSSKPLVVSEWNIGLDCSTEDSFRAARAQSFNASMLTFMQDSSLNIERAHYYGGFGQMSFFTTDTSNVGTVTVHPGAWALKAHSQLLGGTLLGLQVCNESNSCLTGLNTVSSTVQATAVTINSGVKTVISNDSSSNAATTIQIRNWSGSANPTVTVTTYPTSAVTASAALSSSTYTVSTTTASALLSSSATTTTVSSTLTGSTLTFSLTVPPHQAVLVAAE